MRKRFQTFTTLLAVLLTNPLKASENAEEIASKVASEYCQNPSLKKTALKKSSSLRSAENDAAYFVFSDDETDKFCIVSGDGNKVLGYGDNYTDEMPPQLQAVLDAYASTNQQSQPQLKSAEARENIPYFMEIEFGHRAPYNNFLPDRDGKPGPTGCVPTALAQIMKYYEYPSKLMNDIPGYSHRSNSHPDSIYVMEGQKAEGRSYNWDLVLNHYDGDTTEALNNEIAKIMIDCGKSVETRYEQSASAATSEMFYYSLAHYFGYNSDSLQMLSREQFYREEWLDVIYNELSKKRPIYMSATSYVHGGHAFICDGYRDGFLHINWGWNGGSNGYFDVDILDCNKDRYKDQTLPQNGYSFFQKIIIGIVPGIGNTVVSRPKPSSSIIRLENNNRLEMSTRYRSKESGFEMYVAADGAVVTSDIYKNYSVGYINANGDIECFEDGLSAKAENGKLFLEAKKSFDTNSLGQNMTLYLIESEGQSQDWQISDLADPIYVEIPNEIIKDTASIKPLDMVRVGYKSGTSIILYTGIQTEKPKDCMKNIALALVVEGDTLMSESIDYSESNNDVVYAQNSFRMSDMEKELTLIMLQTDEFDKEKELNQKDWTVCENFQPISFTLSDINIFSTDLVVDTIVHSCDSTMHKFEVTFSNPSVFEYYNEVYFYIESYNAGFMLSIPAGGKVKRTIEHEMPVVTNYSRAAIGIINNDKIISQLVFDKDTSSHILCRMIAKDETTLSLQVYNSTPKDYVNTYRLTFGNDTFANQTATIPPFDGAIFNFKLPVVESETDIIKLNNIKYSAYDNDNNLLGSVNPIPYQGTIAQELIGKDLYIHIDLKANSLESANGIRIGVTSTLDNISKYESVAFKNQENPGLMQGSIKYSNYFTQKKPKYIGLCKEDGSFYAYMKLIWTETSDSEDIQTEDTFAVCCADGGVLISSNEEKTRLPIYSAEGQIVKTVLLESGPTTFVPLPSGVYIILNQKVLIK